jgi:putative spermidine/putrescine transport system ATP-binding protein
MNAGHIEQVGTPSAIYNKPQTRFVATFVGTLNTIEGEIEDVAERTVRVDGQIFTLDRLPASAAARQPIALTLRPEVMTLGHGRDITLEGQVEDVNFLGSVIRLKVRLGRNIVSLDTFNDQRTPPPAREERVKVGISKADILVLGN